VGGRHLPHENPYCLARVGVSYPPFAGYAPAADTRGCCVPGVWFDRLSAYFDEAPTFYTFILTSDDYSFLSRRVKHRVAAGLAADFQQDYQLSATDAKLGVNFLIDSTLTLFRLYITKQLGISKAEFRQRMVTLNLKGMQGFLALTGSK